MVEYRFDGKVDVALYTGFLLHHRDRIMWATAGHVIDEIALLRSGGKHTVLRARWLDAMALEGAESVPFDLNGVILFSATSRELDFGVANIHGLPAETLLANKHLEFVTKEAWRNLEDAKPAGFYLVGYPEEGVEVSSTTLGAGKVQRRLKAAITCLPVRATGHRADPTNEFWSDAQEFYGEILPFAGGEAQPGSVKGMSGGPLWSIEAEPHGFRYRLRGIQRSWYSKERLIRCEPVSRLVEEMGA